MIVGVPKEIKPGEKRVGIVPSGVSAFVAHGHTVLVEKGAGIGSGIPDEAYKQAGAKIVTDPKKIWNEAEMIIKVKEPLDNEIELCREGQILYTYLHLASNESLTRELLKRKIIGVAYETIQLEDGSLPLLTPMSEVAGRLSVQVGARCLESTFGGMGVLLGGVSGVKPAKVLIIGAGVAGSNACTIAVGMGANVTVVDINPARLRYIQDVMQGRVTTLMSNRANIAEEATNADLLIGAVLVPGAKAPRLVTKDMVKSMKPNSVIVDIAIDQGGCVETSKPTTHDNPTYRVYDVIHYCVTNMPGAVPRTSTFALTNVTLGYGLMIADWGIDKAIERDKALRKGVNLYKGKLTYKAVAEAFGMEWEEIPLKA